MLLLWHTIPRKRHVPSQTQRRGYGRILNIPPPKWNAIPAFRNTRVDQSTQAAILPVNNTNQEILRAYLIMDKPTTANRWLTIKATLYAIIAEYQVTREPHAKSKSGTWKMASKEIPTPPEAPYLPKSSEEGCKNRTGWANQETLTYKTRRPTQDQNQTFTNPWSQL